MDLLDPASAAEVTAALARHGAAIAAGILAGAALATLAARRLSTRTSQQPRPQDDGPHRRARMGMEDQLTLLAAAIATAVAGQGMWRVAGDILQLPVVLRCLLFAFLEIAVLASAVRARKSMRENGSAGVDGTAVWVLTCLSAVLSSLDARSTAERIARLSAPLVAAWLWERGMAVEHRRVTRRPRTINWRITPERLLIRLGLAEPTDRTASDVDAQRRLVRLALAAAQARLVQRPWHQRLALRRVERATRAAVEHAGLAVQAGRQEELLAHLAVLINAHDLTRLDLPAPWAPAAVSTGSSGPGSPTSPAKAVSSGPLARTGTADRAPGRVAHARATRASQVSAGVREDVWAWYRVQREAGQRPTQGDVSKEFGVPRSTAGRWRSICERTWTGARGEATRSRADVQGQAPHSSPAVVSLADFGPASQAAVSS